MARSILVAVLAFCLATWGTRDRDASAQRAPTSVNFDSLTVKKDDIADGGAFAEGRDILDASRRAYACAESYEGTITLSASAGFPGRSHVERRDFTVVFERPGKLQLKGADSNGDAFSILIDGDSARIEWHGVDRDLTYNSGRDALVAFSGVTLYASLVLPGCLLDVSWHNEDPILPKDKSFLEAWATKARLDGQSEVEGHECHRIICDRETVTWTIFVDKEIKLIRQVDCEMSQTQMEKLKTRGLGGGASGRLMSLKRSQLFLIDQVRWIGKGPDEMEKE